MRTRCVPYLSMDLVGQWVIVPLGLAALITGVVQSLTTQWGVFKHYWVVTKLVLTIGATALLLLHQFVAVAGAAKVAAATPAGVLPNLDKVGTQLVADAAAATLVLIVNTTLSIYKPWGKTRYAMATEQDEARRTPSGVKVFLAIVGLFIAVFAVLHLMGKGLHHHH
jgi:hypothetical protein